MLLPPRHHLDPMNPLQPNGLLRPTEPPTPRQYAIPADHIIPKFTRSKSNGLSYAEHELLRQRKTPHGRLWEEDYPSVDRNIQIPAAKHILLDSSPNRGHLDLVYSQYASPAPSNDPIWSGQASTAQKGMQTTAKPFFQPQAWDFPGGLDSVLNQTLPLQPSQRYYLHHGTRIPTVLPSALHSHWGPTAPASQEMYGPYWPDGTYNPYRPAAVRDSRFYGSRVDDRASVYAQPLPTLLTPSLRRPGKLPTNFHDLSSTPHHSNQHYHDQSIPGRPNQWGFDQSVNIFGQPKPSPYQRQAFQHQTYQPSGYENHYRDEYAQPPSPTLEPTPRSESIAFRDKTFTWANRLYTELITVIQRNARESHQHSGNSGASKPAAKIYPKPPKRSGSHFSESIKGPVSAQSHKSVSSPQQYDLPLDNGPPRPQTAIYAPHRRASDFDQMMANRTMTSVSSPFNPMALKQDFRRTSDSLIQQSTAAQQALAIKEAAFSALGTMELLCEQAQEPWVDGMLLAGCLAYGLGNYEKALSWYQRILKQDAEHVEAMSNLAAALLALGRRDEALQYWSAAVRLRPSYFEAVEHLIGLLCSTRRAKEAVDLIEFVEASLKLKTDETTTEPESDAESHVSSIATMSSIDHAHYDYDVEDVSFQSLLSDDLPAPGFGSSGYAIAGSENGRMLALIHAKGNMLYALGKNSAAAGAFEDAILIATGQRKAGVRGLISKVLKACLRNVVDQPELKSKLESKDPILLAPNQAEMTAKNMFPPTGDLPGLEHVPKGIASKAAMSTTSNSLLSLAKIYQDAMSSALEVGSLRSTSTRDILALYYLSLSLQRSPSTANNVGILLAGVQQSVHSPKPSEIANNHICNVPGVVPGSGVSLALLYYNYGLNLDPKHAHLYTNLGSLLKDIGQLTAAIKMYESAVSCDGNFDIALANLANAVKDQGRVADAISYYKRAVQANPEFAEAVCGLATALNSVCSWNGRGGVFADRGRRDRIHVNQHGVMHEAGRSYGWLNRVVEIVEKQLKEGESWGSGTLSPTTIQNLCRQLTAHQKSGSSEAESALQVSLKTSLQSWSGERWEGSRIVRLIERAIRRIGWQWYQDRYKQGKEHHPSKYTRPLLPSSLSSPSAPTVLPFHTFTTPLSARQVRQISQRNALRISVSTLRSAWMPPTVFSPPPPPRPYLTVGYVSSDFNNHPLAHLMQSIFGLHDPTKIRPVCYASTASDGSIHRAQIEREAPVFHDCSSWSVEKLVKQIVADQCHILINLNGYTRGARNEVFAARPAPIHMSFMGFAGTLGAEWCDYVFADEISVPPDTLSPWRRNVDIEDRLRPDSLVEDTEDWVYSENVIFARETFFCVDHKQSAPDAKKGPPPTKTQEERDKAWKEEQKRRWRLRKELFPTLSDSAIILGNFNQLYKIDPSTFRMYLRILAAVPNAILWLLRFPDLGEQNLLSYAREWAGEDIAGRIVFTDVAPKGMHISRAAIVDLFVDTPECNAHTTAADVVWSGTPVVTWGKWKYKMCSRMAGSIVGSALPEGSEGDAVRKELIVNSEEQYEACAISLARGLRYPSHSHPRHSKCEEGEVKEDTPGVGTGRLMEIRRMLWEGRWTSRLFDTKRWVKDMEKAYWVAWKKWERGEGGDIWL